MFYKSQTLFLSLALSCLLSTGCAISLGVGVGAEDPELSGEEEERSDGEEQADERAELKLRLAELETESSILEAKASLHEAEVELRLARRSLEVFAEGSGPDKLRKAELDSEKTRVRLDEQRATLKQLESDYSRYGDDELARQTAEIVLGRHRARIHFSEVELQLAGRELERLREFELPKKRRELELAVHTAEAELEAARFALEVAHIQGDLDMMEAEEEFDERDRDEEDEGGWEEEGDWDDEDDDEDHE